MNGGGGLVALFISLAIVCLVIGIFFVFRGINRYKDWQAGAKDEFWTFLSLIVGSGSLFLLGIPIAIFVSGVAESAGDTCFYIIFIGLLLGLASIGLTTFYYFQKWRSAK